MASREPAAAYAVLTLPSRRGALATGYDHELMRNAPLTEFGEVSKEQLRDNLQYFLERIVPVAEEANVKLAMHPADLPLSPIRGLGRIMHSIENYQRLLDLVPSPVNGIALCQGNFTLMTDDLPAAICHFGRHSGGQNNIFFVHFRDVRGTPEKFVDRPPLCHRLPRWPARGGVRRVIIHVASIEE